MGNSGDEVPEFICAEPVAVLGDIHGSADALEEILPLLGGREIFVLGDICDRGPDTKRVIDILIERRARGVLGNHEEWFVEWALHGELHRMIHGGGMGAHATFRSYGVKGTLEEVKRGAHRVPPSHRDFLRSLHHVAGLTVCGEQYWLVHAGINSMLVDELGLGADVGRVVPGLHQRRSLAAHWNSGGPQESAPVDRPVIMGHICQDEPVLEDHVLAIDTGAGTTPNGRLSALLLPEREVISVPAPGARL